MKKAISDKDFEKAVFLREREIELQGGDRAHRGAADRDERRDAWKSPAATSRRSSPPGPASRWRRSRAKRPRSCSTWRTSCAGASSARTRAIIGDLPRHPPLAAGRHQPAPADGLVHLPRPVGRRQDRGRAPAGRVPLRQPAGAGALRHVRVHGEARGLQAHRLAARATSATRRAASSPSASAASPTR